MLLLRRVSRQPDFEDRPARAGRRRITMGVALTALYGYLYLLLRLEDLALVAGATGLLVMLAIVMVMTRHGNWFAPQLGDTASPAK